MMTGQPIRTVLMVSPEPPYPLHGGGAFRMASLLHYYAPSAAVDLVLFSNSGQPAEVPPGLLRSQTVIPLRRHNNNLPARYLRNARRAMRGVPPLIDRLSGYGPQLDKAIAGKRWDLAIVEHFWCAPYLDRIAAVSDTTVLDLHNVESVLHARCAQVDSGLVAAGQRRFARCSAALEQRLFSRFSAVLATSQTDAAAARQLSPGTNALVYPNALPAVPVPAVPESPTVVFSGNFEYHPNIDAVEFIAKSIWPHVRRECPGLRLRLVGRGDRFIRHLLPSGLDIEVTGPVDDALREIAAARIVIAPLRAGSGTRIKILEAWAANRPVIATSIAAEGLEYSEDCDLLIANEGHLIAGAIAGLNADPAWRRRLAAGGRATFERSYTWQAAWRALDAVPRLARRAEDARYTGDSDANCR